MQHFMKWDPLCKYWAGQKVCYSFFTSVWCLWLCSIVFNFIQNNFVLWQLSYQHAFKENLSKLVNSCAANLILKMEENMQHFRHIVLYYFKKVKKASEMQQKICAVCGGAVTLTCQSSLWSFLVLLTFWPNNSLLWGCLLHWKRFSSSPGLYPLTSSQ